MSCMFHKLPVDIQMDNTFKYYLNKISASKAFIFFSNIKFNPKSFSLINQYNYGICLYC